MPSKRNLFNCTKWVSNACNPVFYFNMKKKLWRHISFFSTCFCYYRKHPNNDNTIRFARYHLSASFQQCFHESLSAIRHNSDNHHNYLAPTKSVMCEIEANVSPFLFFSITEHGSFSHQARIRKTDLLQFNIKFFKILFTPYGLGEGGKSSPLT